eukprot:11198354-Lingulodinium_polyedra.AAC.1
MMLARAELAPNALRCATPSAHCGFPRSARGDPQWLSSTPCLSTINGSPMAPFGKFGWASSQHGLARQRPSSWTSHCA